MRTRYERYTFIWLLVSPDLRLLINKRLFFSKIVKISKFWLLSVWIEKYKLPLIKLDTLCDNSYCVRLLIVSLAVNVVRLQLLIIEGNSFCCVFNDFCSDFLLCDVMDLLRMYKSRIESCLDKRIKHWLSSFETWWNSLLHLSMVLQRGL